MLSSQKQEVIKCVAGELRNNFGLVITEVSGGYVQYSRCVDNLQYSHYRRTLHNLAEGANMGKQYKAVYCVVNIDGKIKIISLETFMEHLPFKEYQSPIPA